MGKAVKLMGLFFVFMFTGILITGLVLGGLSYKNSFPTSLSPLACQNYISDTANMKYWMQDFRSIEYLGSSSIQKLYKVEIQNNEDKATFELSIRKDTVGENLNFVLSNLGTSQDIYFKFKREDSITNVLIQRKVRGNGIANKFVVAMLHRSIKKQYELETKRIKALLEQSEINLIGD